MCNAHPFFELHREESTGHLTSEKSGRSSFEILKGRPGQTYGGVSHTWPGFSVVHQERERPAAWTNFCSTLV